MKGQSLLLLLKNKLSAYHKEITTKAIVFIWYSKELVPASACVSNIWCGSLMFKSRLDRLAHWILHPPLQTCTVSAKISNIFLDIFPSKISSTILYIGYNFNSKIANFLLNLSKMFTRFEWWSFIFHSDCMQSSMLML